jgi:integrase/recombinase XerC
VANEDNYKQLIAAIPEKTNDARHIRNRAIVGLLWDTGSRNGEICALNIDQLDLVARKALIKTEKSRGRRPVREMFWSEDMNDALLAWMAKRQHLLKKIVPKEPEAVFICINNWNSGARFTVRGVGEMLRHYCNKAKLPYMNAHSFRHHKAHAILHKGGSQADVQNVLGHASLASSSIYTMMFGTELEERARKFLTEPAPAVVAPATVHIDEPAFDTVAPMIQVQRSAINPLTARSIRVRSGHRSRSKAFTVRARFNPPL